MCQNLRAEVTLEVRGEGTMNGEPGRGDQEKGSKSMGGRSYQLPNYLGFGFNK